MHLAVLYAAPALHFASESGSLSGLAQERVQQGSARLFVLPKSAACTSVPGRQTAWQQTQTALLPSYAQACCMYRCAAALQASISGKVEYADSMHEALLCRAPMACYAWHTTR